MAGKKFLLTGIIVILTSVGVFLGHAVDAQEPGTSSASTAGQLGDPLVTKSYIDAEVLKLQNKIDSLQVQADYLRTEVDGLKAEIDKLKAGNTGS